MNAVLVELIALLAASVMEEFITEQSEGLTTTEPKDECNSSSGHFRRIEMKFYKYGFAPYPGYARKPMIARRYPHPSGRGYLIVSQVLGKDGKEISWPTPEQLKEALLEKRHMQSRGVQ